VSTCGTERPHDRCKSGNSNLHDGGRVGRSDPRCSELLGAKPLSGKRHVQLPPRLDADPIATCIDRGASTGVVLEPAFVSTVRVEPRWSGKSICASTEPTWSRSSDRRRSAFVRRSCVPSVQDVFIPSWPRPNVTLPLWEMLEPNWGAQENYAVSNPLWPHRSCRYFRHVQAYGSWVDETRQCTTASVAMFIEEVAGDPRAKRTGPRVTGRRIAGLIAAGRRGPGSEDGQRSSSRPRSGSQSATVRADYKGVWVHRCTRHGVGSGLEGRPRSSTQ